jgi:hypothetical protein
MLKMKQLLISIAALLFAACDSGSSDDNAQFLIVSHDELTIIPDGGVSTVTVECNADWSSALTGGDSWLTADKIATGVRLTAQSNTSQPGSRTATLTVSGAATTRTIAISQASAFKPFLSVPKTEFDVYFTNTPLTVAVNTNSDDWISSCDADWLKLEKVTGGLKVTATKNLENLEARTAVISIILYDAGANIPVNITQLPIFTDDFSWVGVSADGTTNADAYPPTSTNEKRFEVWQTNYGTDNGWTSTKVKDEGTSVQPWVYSRFKYAKMGKTRVSGDLITPKLSIIEGTKNILVSFKAACYLSAGGAADYQDFAVEVIGAGTITAIKKIGGQKGTPTDRLPSSGKLTATGALFVIGNYNNPDASTRPNWYGDDYDMFAPEIAERSFVVTGATSETQIRFIGGPDIGALPVTYRFSFDDVVIIATD